MSMRNKCNIAIITIITIIIVITIPQTVSAIANRMESNSFRLDWGNVNIGGKDQTSSSYTLKTTLGQTAAQRFSSAGYIVRAGFQYWQSIIPFRFSVSKTSINFGLIVPSTFYTDTARLTVSFGGAGQYQVTATELGPMITSFSTSIPDTTCNGGADTCSETSAAVWNSTSTYGFGYNMSGVNSNGDSLVPADFTNSNYFRPFTDRNANEAPAVVMSNSNVGVGESSIMTFKVNVSSTQAAGSYNTVINYVATPSF